MAAHTPGKSYTFKPSSLSTPVRHNYTLESGPSQSPAPVRLHKPPCRCRCFEDDSLQPRLRATKRTMWAKTHDVLTIIQKDFKSLGEFLEYLFDNVERAKDPRTERHTSMVTTLLQGTSNVNIGNIIELIFNHRQSNPAKGSLHVELDMGYSSTIPLNKIRYARPCLSSWATRLVGDKVYRQVAELTKNDPSDPEDRTQLRATRNSRSKSMVPQVTWEDLGRFSIPSLAMKYQHRAPLVWYLGESMAGPRKEGKIVVRKRRPHVTVCLTCLCCV